MTVKNTLEQCLLMVSVHDYIEFLISIRKVGLQSSLMSSSSSVQSIVDQGDITTEHSVQKDKEELATKNDMIDPSSVIAEFLNMKVQLEELLQQCDPMPIVKRCGSLLASDTHNIPLFPTDYTERLQGINT